jgi:hypothetical protein
VQLTLTAEGAAVLEEVLDQYLADVRSEIAHTDAHEFRDHLKRKQEFVRKILQQMAAEGLSHHV